MHSTIFHLFIVCILTNFPDISVYSNIGKARPVYLYSTFHTVAIQSAYIKGSEIDIQNNNKNKGIKNSIKYNMTTGLIIGIICKFIVLFVCLSICSKLDLWQLKESFTVLLVSVV